MWFLPQAFPDFTPRNVPAEAHKLCGAFLILVIFIIFNTKNCQNSHFIFAKYNLFT